ncbi:MAG TPA: ATP-dependent helicase [Pyrinomonadaceae bacterium]|nr:ATP-dependent helicase [Pyrinomonadaceae bacterium]
MSKTEDLYSQILSSDSKHICLIAAPGSGKTSRALIPKVQQILAKPGVDPKNVLILSFSRLSAADLKKRIGATGARASTVHSFCLSLLLSEDNHEIRKRIGSIIFDFERDTLIADLKEKFPTVLKRELGKQLEKFAAGWAIEPHDQVFEENDEKRAFKQAVVNWLDEHQAAMMEEIVYHAVDLAQKVSDLKLLEEAHYIFVDEYQDLNVLEQTFVDLLSAQSELLFVVGDPDQSILSFKYAHPEGITAFAGQTHVDSYTHLKTGRCGKIIVDFARDLLKQSDPTRTALLEALPTNEDGEIHFVRKQTQDNEFAYVLEQVGLRFKAEVSPQDIIILVPKKKLGRQFVEYAEKNKDSVGISQTMGSFKFTSKPEFTDEEQHRILLLALLAHPSSILHFRSVLSG